MGKLTVCPTSELDKRAPSYENARAMNVPLLDLKAQHQTIRAEVMAAVERVFDSQQFILGAEVEAFEREAAAYCRVKHAIGCGSGSDALLLALMALGVGPGDEVVTVDDGRKGGLIESEAFWININRETQGPARISDEFLEGLIRQNFDSVGAQTDINCSSGTKSNVGKRVRLDACSRLIEAHDTVPRVNCHLTAISQHNGL